MQSSYTAGGDYIKKIYITALSLLIICCSWFPVWADNGDIDNIPNVNEVTENEETENLLNDDDNDTESEIPTYEDYEENEDTDENEDLNYFEDIELLLDIYGLLNERLQMPVSDELEEPPPIHEAFGASGITTFGIADQPTYPYTGGGFAHVNTNYGNGIILVPNPCRQDTFGFQKGTDRIYNLTPSAITGFWIVNGSTYNLRFTALGQPEYYYYTGSTYQWRTLTISKLNDSNIQFLDDTGERGIQRPFFSLTDRLLIVLILVELFIHLIRRR